MATIAGKDAAITIASYDAYAHVWSMDIVADPLEDTNWDWAAADEGWRSYIFGLRGFSGTFECYADATPTAALLPGTKVTDAQFYTDVDNSKGYKGDILITGAHPSVAIDGIETYTFDYQGSGALAVGAI